jgi:hypothetical protein
MRLDVVLRVPSSVSRRNREKLMELVAYVLTRETFTKAIEQIGLENISVSAEPHVLHVVPPQAPDAAG